MANKTLFSSTKSKLPRTDTWNGRILRTIFQMVRSGQFGRTSLSSSPERAFQRWLNNASAATMPSDASPDVSVLAS